MKRGLDGVGLPSNVRILPHKLPINSHRMASLCALQSLIGPASEPFRDGFGLDPLPLYIYGLTRKEACPFAACSKIRSHAKSFPKKIR